MLQIMTHNLCDEYLQITYYRPYRSNKLIRDIHLRYDPSELADHNDKFSYKKLDNYLGNDHARSVDMEISFNCIELQQNRGVMNKFIDIMVFIKNKKIRNNIPISYMRIRLYDPNMRNMHNKLGCDYTELSIDNKEYCDYYGVKKYHKLVDNNIIDVFIHLLKLYRDFGTVCSVYGKNIGSNISELQFVANDTDEEKMNIFYGVIHKLQKLKYPTCCSVENSYKNKFYIKKQFTELTKRIFHINTSQTNICDTITPSDYLHYFYLQNIQPQIYLYPNQNTFDTTHKDLLYYIVMLNNIIPIELIFIIFYYYQNWNK